MASLAYPISNQLAAAGGQSIVLKLPIDDLIPFSSIFIIPYFYWHLQIYITILWLVFSSHTGRLLHRLVIILVIADLLSAVFYLAMPTFMIRPEIMGDDLLSQLVRMIYAIDLPYNLFPSKHVTWALILNRAWAAAGPKRLWFRLLNHTGTLMIIASTVLIKQHYTPDILGGMAVAAASIALGGLAWKHFAKSPVFGCENKSQDH